MASYVWNVRYLSSTHKKLRLMIDWAKRAFSSLPTAALVSVWIKKKTTSTVAFGNLNALWIWHRVISYQINWAIHENIIWKLYMDKVIKFDQL